MSYSACSTLNLVRALLCCQTFASSLSYYAAKGFHISHDLCTGSFSGHNYWPAGIGVVFMTSFNLRSRFLLKMLFLSCFWHL